MVASERRPLLTAHATATDRPAEHERRLPPRRGSDGRPLDEPTLAAYVAELHDTRPRRQIRFTEDPLSDPGAAAQRGAAGGAGALPPPRGARAAPARPDCRPRPGRSRGAWSPTSGSGRGGSPGPRPSALMHADERENQTAGAGRGRLGLGRGRLGFGDRGVDRSVACTAAVRPNRANVRGRAPSVTRQRLAGQMYPLQWDPTTDAMIATPSWLPRYACGHQRRLQAPPAMHEPTRQPIGEGRQRAAPPRRRSSCPPTGSQRRHAPPPRRRSEWAHASAFHVASVRC